MLSFTKKERVSASKKTKTETITKPKNVIDLGEELPFLFAVSNVDLENLNLSITTNIRDLLAPLIQQVREIRDFLNLHAKCMDLKPNLNNDLSNNTCDKDLVIENEILEVKLEESDQKNSFLRGEVKDLTVLLNANIQKPLLIILKHTKKCLLP